jgi:hypothetical protein
MGIFFFVFWGICAFVCVLATSLVIGVAVGTDHLAQQHWEGWRWIGVTACCVLAGVGFGWLRWFRRWYATNFSQSERSPDPQARAIAACIKWPGLGCTAIFLVSTVASAGFLVVRARGLVGE